MAVGEVATVEQERVTCAGVGDRELVHDPAFDADELVLGALTEDGQVRAGNVGECASDGHLECGRGREADPLGKRAGDAEMGSFCRLEQPDDPADVVTPGAGRLDQTELKDVRFAEIGRIDGDQVVLTLISLDGGEEIDRDGKDETAVVVGVLAEEVDPSRGPRRPGGPDVHAARSRSAASSGVRSRCGSARSS